MLTTSFITTRLSEVAVERGITIRHANESGSRAWGLESTDSDYDVRFIYQHPKEWYLRLDRPKDMIGPIMELDGELDLAGWDLRKVLSHIAGSNAGVIEWLYSPVVYHLEEGFLVQLRALSANYFQPAKVAAHYLGIARSAKLAGYDEASDNWNLKKYFYFLRPILAADYVLREGHNPPVTFAELLARIKSTEIRNVLDELIAHKVTVGESHRIVVPQLLTDYFDTFRETTSTLLDETPRRTTERTEADALFRDLIGY
ncbi:nucleotidyltransferase domain-containing protein [Neolewinella aurantiaca]|uniref:Nucleotidyltransferase domain-containing protein n=1 Tax=Neolewinella aurantiaca TaxID=2602767 RepID=A0A5C7FUI1_9BACT|nr:nucleotidyltransferase domain-containing protein [Neolewinella aurantiaca]TXF89974.1 nucleotidyltransferase domain-containing protein [Neolewinella aurantiaca]